ncbi:MAG: hypothetical protein AAGF45_00505 [Pseudomonadota bacterium]
MAPPKIPPKGLGNTEWMKAQGTAPDLHSDKAEPSRGSLTSSDESRKVDPAFRSKQDKDQKDQNQNNDKDNNGGDGGGNGHHGGHKQRMTPEELAKAQAEIRSQILGGYRGKVNLRVYVGLSLLGVAMTHVMRQVSSAALIATLSHLMSRMTVSRAIPSIAQLASATTGAAVMTVAALMLSPSKLHAGTLTPLQKNKAWMQYYIRNAQHAKNPFALLEAYAQMYFTLYSYMIILDNAMNSMLATASKKHRSVTGHDQELIQKTVTAVQHYRQSVHDVARQLTDLSNTADKVMAIVMRHTLHNHGARLLISSHFRPNFQKLESEASRWYASRANIGATHTQVIGYLDAGKFPH